MKGYTIQHSIDLLEKAVEENGGGSGGASTAADVTYDNTTSGLTAENVQAAIDEIDQDLGGVSTSLNTLSGTVEDAISYGDEVKIGKLGNKDLYRTTVTINAFPTTPFTATNYAHNIANIENIVDIRGIMNFSSGTAYPLNMPNFTESSGAIALGVATVSAYADKTNIVIMTAVDRGATSGYVTLEYTKTAANSTRSKKK